MTQGEMGQLKKHEQKAKKSDSKRDTSQGKRMECN